MAGGSGSESFGKGFYITLSLIPVGLVAWVAATSSETTPWLTRVIQSFRERREELDRRNTLHQAASEQAAFDRRLFATASPSVTRFELRYPEVLNRSSPWNVVAGWGGADLTKLMEHYARENEEAERLRVARIKPDGKITTVYDDTTGGRLPSWVPWIGGSKKVAPDAK